MPRPSWITEQAWEVIQVAKSIALTEGSGDIISRHLFQACAVAVGALVKATLSGMSLGKDDVDRYLHSIMPSVPPQNATTAQRPLSSQAEGVIQQSRALASQFPEDATALVTPIHLWTSVCSAADALREWLLKCGWLETHIRGLAEAARAQLPKSIRVAQVGPKEAELETLKRFCNRNLTELARQGRLTPAYGMEETKEQMIRCLLRKDRRSLVLTGPAGVGKTKLVEDLAVRISSGNIPELEHCQVFELDLALFTRGTHYAGSRAERWTQLTEVLRANPDGIILFIDELHTIIGLPLEGQAMDLSNALKPLLVDDKVRIIGSTTTDEYRRHIEGDPALARRFTEVKVPEPDRDTVMNILESVAPRYEEYHGIKYHPDTLEAIYELTRSCLPNQSFPAKAMDLLDEIGVTVKVRNRKGQDNSLEQKPVAHTEDVRETLKRIWGIEPDPLNVDISGLIKERVVGQDHAANKLSDLVVASAFRYGKETQRGPRAVILFLGPPGVGKSYMAQVLADILFPGRDSLLTLDMTEFSGPHAGEHAQFRLLGPPPPYVGWETSGVLTSHAVKHPVSVVLVDEFEKANTEARNVLLRIFDEGLAQDGRGRIVSFKEMYFILTANAAQEMWRTVRRLGFTPEQGDEEPMDAQADRFSDDQIREALLRGGFLPELLSRISHVVMFNNLNKKHLEQIASRELANLRDNALMEDFLLLEYDEHALSEWLVKQTAPGLDCRRLAAAFGALVEIPLARWRMQRVHEAAIVKLEPNDNEVRLQVGEQTSDQSRIQQLLFERVAVVFAKKQQREKRERTAHVLLGTSG
jgi:ATP-dependent Clp protease ATP-binding subunit ClpC